MFGFGKPSKYENIDPARFNELMAAPNTIVLDVRTPAEISENAIPNHTAINFMALDFGKKIEQLDKDKTYLVYCRSGARSASACRKMGKKGFSQLFNLSGGINAWNKQ